jgi:hypothetical protein
VFVCFYFHWGFLTTGCPEGLFALLQGLLLGFGSEVEGGLSQGSQKMSMIIFAFFLAAGTTDYANSTDTEGQAALVQPGLARPGGFHLSTLSPEFPEGSSEEISPAFAN